MLISEAPQESLSRPLPRLRTQVAALLGGSGYLASRAKSNGLLLSVGRCGLDSRLRDDGEGTFAECAREVHSN